MTLANVQGKLSRAEMKNVMAGNESIPECTDQCTTNADCPLDRYCGGGECAGGKQIKRCNKYA